jgi:uncharacterized protein DUF6399
MISIPLLWGLVLSSPPVAFPPVPRPVERSRRASATGRRARGASLCLSRRPLAQRAAALAALKEWHLWAAQRVQAFQRTSSAVEGRNGYLSQMHHNHRGLPKQRYKVWTALHNFDCHAADGTTPASRFFRRTFPDLFETVSAHIEELPRPRKRHQAMALTG